MAESHNQESSVDEIRTFLKPDERMICEGLLGADNIYSKRAKLLLEIDRGATQTEAGREAGLSRGQVKYCLRRFREYGIDIFPPDLIDSLRRPLEAGNTAKQVVKSEPEGEGVSEGPVGVEAIEVGEDADEITGKPSQESTKGGSKQQDRGSKKKKKKKSEKKPAGRGTKKKGKKSKKSKRLKKDKKGKSKKKDKGSKDKGKKAKKKSGKKKSGKKKSIRKGKKKEHK